MPVVPAAVVPSVLWHVTAVELRALDVFEACDPADSAGPCGEYRRVGGRAHTLSGKVACWLYIGGTIAATSCQ